MAKQKEKTLEELQRKTKKLAESRPSCVLEGKATMRGPGVNDPVDDAGSKQVCDLCGSSVHEDDGCVCSSCDRGFHTSCLELPFNELSVVDWQCSQCRSKSPVANEALLNSSSNTAQNVMACTQDSEIGNHDGFLKGEIQSGSQDTSCPVSKSIGSDDDGGKTADHLGRSQKAMDEDANLATLEDTGKSCHGQGESSKQSLALEAVRRSKRGRPYKPVGGLHPNKRRSVDSFSRHSDKVFQGKLKPSTDEEDELGAKVEKFRVISSIDEIDRTGALSCKDMCPNFDRAFRSEEQGDVDTETSVEVNGETTRRAFSSASSLATAVDLGVDRYGADNKITVISCEAKLRSPMATDDCALEKAATELDKKPTTEGEFLGSLSSPVHQVDSCETHQLTEGILDGSLVYLVPQCENTEICGNEQSVLDESKDSQQMIPNGMLGIEHPDEQWSRKVQLVDPGKLQSPSREDVRDSKNSPYSVEGKSEMNSGMSMAQNVLCLSNSAEAGSSARASTMQDTSKGEDLANDSSLHEDKLVENSDGGVEGESGNMTSSTVLGQGQKETILPTENRVRDTGSKGGSDISIGMDMVFQDNLGTDSRKSTVDSTKDCQHSGKKENLESETGGCLLENSVKESYLEGFMEVQKACELPLNKISLDKSSQLGYSAQDGVNQCSIKSKPLTGSVENVILKAPSKLVAMGTVLNSTSGTQEGSLVLAIGTQTGSSLVPPTVSPSRVRTTTYPTSATNHDSEYPPSQSSPTSVLLEKSQAEVPSAVKASSEFSAVVAGTQTSVVPSGSDKLKNSILQTATPAHSELKGTGADDGPVPCLDAAPVRSLPAETGMSRDDSVDKVSGEPPVPLSSSSEEVLERGLQSSSLEEEDDVKVCDICGDAGYEECLAVCSACSEGAEHIYCMQALLHTVPEDGWLCEGCKLLDTTENVKDAEDCSPNRVLLGFGHLSPKRKQIMKSNTRSRLSALLDKGKGTSSQRKGATKGPPNHQLSTKRPADDIAILPSNKKQALENPGVLPPLAINMPAARGVTREGSFKTPDSGKVKFLSPNALVSMPVGGGVRNTGKSSGFTGVLSHSPRPGLGQSASKNRHTTSSGVSSDLAGVATVATKQLQTPRLPSPHISAPPTPGRALKLSEPLPPFLIPSRSGSMKGFASSKGTSDGNGVQPLYRETSSGSQFGRGSGKEGTGVASAKIPTPRQSTQLPGSGMQFSLKGDTAVGSLSFDNSGIPSKISGSQKHIQVSDSLKSLSRLPSSSRLSLSQHPRHEGKPSHDLQVGRGSRQDPKFGGSSIALTSNPTSILNSPTGLSQIPLLHSQDVDILEGSTLKLKAFSDLSKGKLLHPQGTIVVDSQRNVGGAPHNETSASDNLKKLSKVSMIPSSSSKQIIMDDIANKSSQELQPRGIEMKWKDIPETSWPSSKVVSSISTTRCYKCKEIGHTVQTCSSRNTLTTGLADLVTSNSGMSASMVSPKESLKISSACPWKGVGPRFSDSSPLGENKYAVTSPAGQVPSQVVECGGAVPLPETSEDANHRFTNMGASGSAEEAPKKNLDESKRELATSMLPSEVGILSVQNGRPEVVTSRGLQSMMLETEKLKSNLEKDTLRRQISMPAPLNDIRNLGRIPSQNGRRQEGFPIGNLLPLEALTEVRRPDNRIGTAHEVSPRLPNQLSQASCGEPSLLSRPGAHPVPVNFPIRPLEPPLPTPMMMMQLKGLSPWTQLVPPRPMFGGVNQDARGIRVGGGTGHGVGVPTVNTFGSPSPPAVPESQCLWRGGFEVVSAAVPAFYDGLQGYSSSFAAPKVRAVTKTLPHRLQLEEVRRLFNADAWPKQFQLKPPTDKEIALYFFAENESFERGYIKLLEHMMIHDLVLMGQVEGAELLIFPSHLLPVEYHRWKNKMFLWAVYRARKPNPVSTAIPPVSAQSDAVALVQSSPKLLGDATSLVQSSTKIAGLGRAEKLDRIGTPVVSGRGDSGEVDMEIDVTSDKEVPQKPLRKSGWDKPATNAGPPLPEDPAPVQPPPPIIQTAGSMQDWKIAQDTILMEITPEECDSDLPPGFGPLSQKQVPSQIEPPGFESKPPAQIEPPGFKSNSSTQIEPPGFESKPPGFEKVKDGVVPITMQINAAGDGLSGSMAADDGTENTGRLQCASKRESNGAERLRPLVNSGQTPSPSPRDLRDDSGFGVSRASTHGLSLSSSQSPVWHRDKPKDQSAGSRSSGYSKEKGNDREGNKGEPRNDKEPRRERHRGRSLERVKGKGRSRDGEREKERSCDGDREKKKSRDGDREEWSHDRDREKEWSRDAGWEKERSCDRDRGKERSRERCREERSRERDREKEKSQERGRERERYRERDREKARDRHKHYRHKDRDRGRESKYRRHAQSRSQSKSCSHCHSPSIRERHSPSVSPKRRHSPGKCRSRHRSRSYSNSPDSNGGRPWRKPASTDRCTESREQSQDGTVRRVTHPDNERVGKIGQEAQNDEASLVSKIRVYSGIEHTVMSFDVAQTENSKFGKVQPTVASIPFYNINQQDGEAESLNSLNVENVGDTVPRYHVFLAAESGGAQLEAGVANDEIEHPFFLNVLPPSGGRASNLDLLANQPSLEILENSGSWEIDKPEECSGYQFFPVKAGNAGGLKESVFDPSLELALGGKDRKSIQKLEALPFFGQHENIRESSLEVLDRCKDLVGSPGLQVGYALATNTRAECGSSERCSPLNLTLSVPQYRKEGNKWVKIEQAEGLLGEEELDSLKLGL